MDIISTSPATHLSKAVELPLAEESPSEPVLPELVRRRTLLPRLRREEPMQSISCENEAMCVQKIWKVEEWRSYRSDVRN